MELGKKTGRPIMQESVTKEEATTPSGFFTNVVNATWGIVGSAAGAVSSVVTNATVTIIGAATNVWGSSTAEKVTEAVVAVVDTATDAVSTAATASVDTASIAAAAAVEATADAASIAAAVVADVIESIQNKVGQKLNGEDSDSITESASALKNLKSFMEKLQTDSPLSLRDKKNQFLAVANTHIEKLTNVDLMLLFNDYQNDMQKSKSQYFFIYAEDVNKSVGFIKQRFFSQKKPTGNTNTHKQFLGLLKKRALMNIVALKKREEKQLITLFSNVVCQHAMDEIKPLMTTTRGRVGNAFVRFGAGYEGDYRR